MELTHISLFSGIGGIDIAAEWAGFKVICFVEIDKYCQKVLRKHWPNVPIIEDVKDVTAETIMAYTNNRRQPSDLREEVSRGKEATTTDTELGSGSERGATLFSDTPEERIQEIMADSKSEYSNGIKDNSRDSQRPQAIPKSGDTGGQGYGITLISGGFPCQPHSVAGKREGSTDERNLWPEFRRVIGEIMPRWVLAENVPGLFTSDARRYFGVILSDLAEMGYSVGWATYGAVDVGALHRRNRVFIVGHSRSGGFSRDNRGRAGKEFEDRCMESREGIVAYSEPFRLQKGQPRSVSGISRGGKDCKCPTSESSKDVADTTGKGLQNRGGTQVGEPRGEEPESDRCDSPLQRLQDDTGIIAGERWWAVEPDVGRVAHGIPSRVDRLKCLGNAVVPQQIYPILKGIAEIDQINIRRQW